MQDVHLGKELIKASKAGDASTVVSLLHAGADLNVRGRVSYKQVDGKGDRR